MTKKVFLSVIVPAYNESTAVENLWVISRYLKKKRFKSEIIVVNDGSADNTARKVGNLILKERGIRLISHHPNRGKGYAVKKGILSATGDFRLFIDFDLSTPIEELDKFLPYLTKYPIVIGTRRSRLSQVLVPQSRIRKFMGALFIVISRAILKVEVSDFTCGFKCFSAECAQTLFPQLGIERWGFDSELLFLATKVGYKIKEVPIVWRNDTSSNVKFPQDALFSLSEIIKIKLNDLKGAYKSLGH